MRVSWTARRSNQSVLKEINPEYSVEGLMLKAEAAVFWSSDAKDDLLEKSRRWERLKAEREEGIR